jgi:putative membrane protein
MLRKIWVLIFCVVLIWSAIKPHDYFTWFLEIAPALIGLVVLWKTEKTFSLTPLVYSLILIHCIVLMVGGHYTYAEVPLFNTIKDMFEMSRNNYDKIGHFTQGFVPAMIAREIFVRKKIINSKAWENFLIVSFCLAFSALYELIEWWVAICSGESAEAFLGTQGYVWDTQSDMGLALLGALIALLTLSKSHNKQLIDFE